MKQKTLHVDFNDSTLGTIAREGEHNRTQLVFALDEDLQACDFINVEFGIESSGEKLVLENLCPEEGDNTLKVSLTQDVTVSGVLTIQLVGYVIDSATSEPQIIAKSPVVSGAVTPSINGVKKIAQGVAGLLDRILAKVNDLAKKAHTHRNHKTLEGFYCESLETGFSFDASSNELKWQGKPVAFDFAGSKVSMVQEVEKEGRRYYRLWFTHGSFSVTNVPDYIDIPIDTLNKVTESNGNITLNGAELDLGLGAKAGGIKSVTALPETANEGDVVYYCPPPNRLTAADLGHKVYLNNNWVNECPEPEKTALNRYTLRKDGQATGALTFNKNSLNATAAATLNTMADWHMVKLNYIAVDGSYAFSANESFGKTESTGANKYLPCAFNTFNLPEFDSFEPSAEQMVDCAFFYVLPRFYHYTNGEWVELPYSEPELLNEVDCTLTDTSLTYGILPNILYRFGEVDMLNIDLLLGEVDKVNEYLFSFISGETATVLTLPSSVKWVNELTVEANKRYEISVVDNVALWCAVDYEVTE